MKKINEEKRYGRIPMNLQFFAEEGEGTGDDGQDDPEGEESDENGGEGEPEKKYTEAEMEAAIEKRLARERRKMKRQQEKQENGSESDEEEKRKTEEKTQKLEVKVACYEAGVAKDAVEDVAALAKAYMEADETLDLEDAIEKVVKKYPQFKKVVENTEEEEKGGSWGQRQSGRSSGRKNGVEAAFLKKNPGLKID